MSSSPLPRIMVLGANLFEDSMESHVVEAIREIGCEVGFASTRPAFEMFGRFGERITSRLTGLLLREPERLTERALLNAIAKFQPGLVLVILGNELSPKTVARIRATVRAPIVCWFQDALTSLGRQYVLGAGYDAVFVKDRHLQRLFSRMIRSTTFHYLPEACNPRVHRPFDLTVEDRTRYGCDVMIAGTLYYYRQEILQSLSEFDLRIWGGSFAWMQNRLGRRYQGHALFGEAKGRAARAAKIALNTLHYAEIDGLNCRAFELAGFGAFQLVTAQPVLAEHFVPGEELETFSDINELKQKVHHYLRHPEAAARIAESGQNRAFREHTYSHRVREILRLSGLTS